MRYRHNLLNPFKKADGRQLKVPRGVPNYDKIPHSTVSKAFGVWQPFYKFTWAALPIMARNMIEQPLKMAKWFTLGRGLNDVSAHMLGLDPDDPSTEDMRALLPGYVAKGIFAPNLFTLVTKVDKYGRLQFLDASYYIPGANLVGGERNLVYDIARDKGVPELAAQLLPIQQLDPGNPVLRAAAEIWLNKQGFNDMEIVNENAPLEIKKEKYARYLFNTITPNILSPPKSTCIPNPPRLTSKIVASRTAEAPE